LSLRKALTSREFRAVVQDGHPKAQKRTHGAEGLGDVARANDDQLGLGPVDLHIDVDGPAGGRGQLVDGAARFRVRSECCGRESLGLAVLTEATLSFLGVGMPASKPSLGTLIRIGNEYLFSGVWWVVVFPSVVLALLVLAVNLLGDWLRDALNPKLR